MSDTTRQKARAELPPSAWDEFDRLADDYQFAVFERTGRKFVSYPVIAELIRLGWMRGEKP